MKVCFNIMEEYKILNNKVKLLDLETLGINQKEFLRFISPSFEKIFPDKYDVEREQTALLKTYYGNLYNSKYKNRFVNELPSQIRKKYYDIKHWRERSISKFNLFRINGKWKVKRIKSKVFRQKGGKYDYRTKPRKFHEMSHLITNHEDFQKLLICVAQLVIDFRPKVKKLSINCHQIRTIARQKFAGSNSPEGIHLDGSDFLVPALVINRNNITGGVSEIYSHYKKLLFSRILQPGQLMFHEDIWHNVTPIRIRSKKKYIGKRDIIGFDIDVLN